MTYQNVRRMSEASQNVFRYTHTRPIIAEHQSAKCQLITATSPSTSYIASSSFGYVNQVVEKGKTKRRGKKSDSTRDRTGDLECVRLM